MTNNGLVVITGGGGLTGGGQRIASLRAEDRRVRAVGLNATYEWYRLFDEYLQKYGD